MRNRPTAGELLEIFRRSLREESPAMPPTEKRRAGVIRANLLAIVGRELAAGDRPAREELERLRALYNEQGKRLAEGPAVTAEVARLSRRLAADLRSGAHETADGALAEPVRRHLLETTLQSLRENNPDYLKAEGFT